MEVGPTYHYHYNNRIVQGSINVKKSIHMLNMLTSSWLL